MTIKKRALLMGLNYTGTESALGGCINDVVNLKALLQDNFKYSESQITVMTDYGSGTNYPSRGNIIAQLDKLVKSTINDGLDEIWLSYSGHGSYTRDRNNDEGDGYDEVLCPLDYDKNGYISDDILHKFLQRIPESCRVICLFDCCHSGTICDLKHKYIQDKDPDSYKTVYKRERVPKLRRGRIVGYRWRKKKIVKRVEGRWIWKSNLNNESSEIKCHIIAISGCRDPQTSADVFYNQINQWNGALTKAFINVIQESDPNLSYRLLSRSLNQQMLEQKLSQKPVLCTSWSLNHNNIFYQNPKYYKGFF